MCFVISASDTATRFNISITTTVCSRTMLLVRKYHQHNPTLLQVQNDAIELTLLGLIILNQELIILLY